MWAGFILDSLKLSMKAKMLLCGEVTKNSIAGLGLCKIKVTRYR